MPVTSLPGLSYEPQKSLSTARPGYPQQLAAQAPYALGLNQPFNVPPMSP